MNGECDFDSRLLGVLCKIVPSFKQKKFILSLTGVDKFFYNKQTSELLES